jgi:hypothetical protein
MNVLGRIEEIVAKAVDAGEPTLPRSLISKVTVLLREQVDTQAAREQVVAEASTTFAKRYAAQLQSALERAAAVAPQPTAPPAIARPEPAAPRAPRAPKPATGGGRRLVTRHLDPRQLSSVPTGLRVTYQGVGATIEPPGMVLDDGKSFDNPTPAAMWVNRGEHVNGWSVWKLSDGRSLLECWDTGQNWPEVI